MADVSIIIEPTANGREPRLAGTGRSVADVVQAAYDQGLDAAAGIAEQGDRAHGERRPAELGGCCPENRRDLVTLLAGQPARQGDVKAELREDVRVTPGVEQAPLGGRKPVRPAACQFLRVEGRPQMVEARHAVTREIVELRRGSGRAKREETVEAGQPEGWRCECRIPAGERLHRLRQMLLRHARFQAERRLQGRMQTVAERFGGDAIDKLVRKPEAVAGHGMAVRRGVMAEPSLTERPQDVFGIGRPIDGVAGERRRNRHTFTSLPAQSHYRPYLASHLRQGDLCEGPPRDHTTAMGLTGQPVAPLNLTGDSMKQKLVAPAARTPSRRKFSIR